MKRPAFSLLAFLLAATPALADAPYRDARLAGYLVPRFVREIEGMASKTPL